MHWLCCVLSITHRDVVIERRDCVKSNDNETCFAEQIERKSVLDYHVAGMPSFIDLNLLETKQNVVDFFGKDTS